MRLVDGFSLAKQGQSLPYGNIRGIHGVSADQVYNVVTVLFVDPKSFSIRDFVPNERALTEILFM